MKSAPHEERQHGRIGRKFVAIATHEIEFLCEQELRDFELHVVGKPIENELLGDPARECAGAGGAAVREVWRPVSLFRRVRSFLAA